VKYSSSIEYADQTDEIIHEAIRKAMSGTPARRTSSSRRTSSWRNWTSRLLRSRRNTAW
jgi:hypothetical protein